MPKEQTDYRKIMLDAMPGTIPEIAKKGKMCRALCRSRTPRSARGTATKLGGVRVP